MALPRQSYLRYALVILVAILKEISLADAAKRDIYSVHSRRVWLISPSKVLDIIFLIYIHEARCVPS